MILALVVLGAACGRSGLLSEVGDDGSDGGVGDAAGLGEGPDIRFKWVGATVGLQYLGSTNGGTAQMGTMTMQGLLGATPLELSGEVSANYTLFSIPADLGQMNVLVTSGLLPQIDQDLAQAVDSRSIVVSLDASHESGAPADPAQGIYNAVVSGSVDGITYLPAVRTNVTASDLPTWSASQAAAGNVVTALCPKDDGVYATAFGRTGDPTRYETQVVSTPLGELVSKLEELAAGGYVITALGRDGTGVDGAGGFLAVGTRPAGQTAPRTIKSIDEPCVVGAGGPGSPARTLLADGFAVVGAIFHGTAGCNGAPTWLYIGER